jgi:predicted PurR-regulated permease PerM
MGENAMQDNPEPMMRARSISFYVILGALLFAIIRSFALVSPILLSFLLIVLISLAINPLVSRMRAFAGGRKGATALIAAALVVLIGLTGWAVVGPMKTSFTSIAKDLPGYWERLQKPLIKMEQQAVLTEEKFQAEVTTEIEITERAPGEHEAWLPGAKPLPSKATPSSETIRSRLSEMLQGVVGSFTAMAFNAAQVLVVLGTVFIGVCFTLMDPRPILGAMFSLVPEHHHGRALIIMRRIGKFVPGWAGATLTGMLAIGLLVLLIMWPIFGFKDALILGLIAGVLEAVPFIGPIFSAVPALLLALGMGGMTPLWVLIGFIAVQVMENNVILPFVMARGMKLHPVAVIFSMLLCVAAFGVLGVLVAAPLVAIADIVHDELFRKRFLPTVTDADLDRLAGSALHEKQSTDK